jgi:hypothetical protein
MVDQARPNEEIRVLLTGLRHWFDEDGNSDDRHDRSNSCVVDSDLAISDSLMCISY